MEKLFLFNMKPARMIRSGGRALLCFIFLTTYSLSLIHAQTGTWTAVKNLSPDMHNGGLTLLTDGTVICHTLAGGANGYGWDHLTPDATGSYANGTWDTIRSMLNERLFFSTQVLPSGNVYVAGGEYGGGGTAGEFYNPLTNTWTLANGVPTGWNIYDGNSEILYNGNVLEGPQLGATPSFDCLFWNEATNTYTIAPSAPLNHDEAAWLKLPDSSVLFVGIASDSATRYIPQTNTWIRDATVPGILYDGAEEMGGTLMLPDGRAVFFGATGFNVIYTPTGNASPGTWTTIDSFPIINGYRVGTPDAPCAMMVNGKILCAVSPIGTSSGEFASPCYFVEYDYTTNTFTQVTAAIPGFGGDSIPSACYQVNMIDLPDGNVLLSNYQQSYANQYYVYTPGSGPIPQGKPTIDNITKINCNTYSITGKLFNGISEGADYGDDWQFETNFPIVRLTNGSNVYYTRTSNWNRIGAVQTGNLEDTATFVVPAVPGGTYSLVVVANGFASNPVLFTTWGAYISSKTNLTCAGGNRGGATVTAADGATPYTYSWSPAGGSNSSASNLSAGTYTVFVTDSVGCTVNVPLTITQPPLVTIAPYRISYVTCHGDSNGSVTTIASGGSAPYTYSWSGGRGNNSGVSGLKAGNYTVTVSDSCGNSSTALVMITQPTAVLLVMDSVNIAPDSSCNGEALAVVSGGVPPFTYSWTPGGSTNWTISGLCSGNYCCVVTDNNGCSLSACTSIASPEGIAKISSGNDDIKVYPNPSNGKFTIVETGHDLSIEVYNVLGERVYSQSNIQNSTSNINLSSEPNGIYFYRVVKEDGDLLGEGKVVIER